MADRQVDVAPGLHHHGPVYQSPHPPIDPAELRPRKRWFWIAGVIAAAGILIGVGGGVALFVYGAGSIMPDSHSALTGTGTATGRAQLTADKDWAVFSTTDASWDVACTAEQGGRRASVTDPGENSNFTRNGETWYEVARVKVPADGAYVFSCRPSADATGSDVQTAHYFVGEAPELGTFFGGLFGGFAVLFGVPFLAVLAAVIISVVTGVKRGNHRKRLMAQRYGPPAYPR